MNAASALLGRPLIVGAQPARSPWADGELAPSACRPKKRNLNVTVVDFAIEDFLLHSIPGEQKTGSQTIKAPDGHCNGRGIDKKMAGPAGPYRGAGGMDREGAEERPHNKKHRETARHRRVPQA